MVVMKHDLVLMLMGVYQSCALSIPGQETQAAGSVHIILMADAYFLPALSRRPAQIFQSSGRHACDEARHSADGDRSGPELCTLIASTTDSSSSHCAHLTDGKCLFPDGTFSEDSTDFPEFGFKRDLQLMVTGADQCCAFPLPAQETLATGIVHTLRIADACCLPALFYAFQVATTFMKQGSLANDIVATVVQRPSA